jgi:EAL and modified HD-GYP domain-containing signal transduction protein
MEFSIYLACQPIYNRQSEIFAYELLYRDTEENRTEVVDNLKATARVLVNTLNYIGLKTLTQGHKAFVKVDDKVLFDDIINSISPAYFVLEILESSIISPELVDRVRELHHHGYRFALNHYRADDDFAMKFQSLLPVVDYVKVDLAHTREPGRIMSSLERYNLKYIAEKIETPEVFEQANAYGFHYFQGYHFCTPALFEKENFDPDNSLLLELIYLLKTDAPLEEILEKFDTSAYLTINLLKFIRLQEGLAQDAIASIEQALVLIGRERLSNWLELMFYADGETAVTGFNSHARDVTRRALQRACLMEELAHTVRISNRFADAAYITGILSIAEEMTKNGCNELLGEVTIDHNIADALVKKKGELGHLLELVVAIEKNDTHKVGALILQMDIPEKELNRCLLESYRRSILYNSAKAR